MATQTRDGRQLEESRRPDVHLWRKKYLTAGAPTLDEMINTLEAAAALLRDMRDAGLRVETWVGDKFTPSAESDSETTVRFWFQDEP